MIALICTEAAVTIMIIQCFIIAIRIKDAGITPTHGAHRRTKPRIGIRDHSTTPLIRSHRIGTQRAIGHAMVRYV
jgi:hypothetical protein